MREYAASAKLDSPATPIERKQDVLAYSWPDSDFGVSS
jgi:hypothetical protein